MAQWREQSPPTNLFFLLEKLQKRAQGPEGARRRYAEGPPKNPEWYQTFYQNFEYREVKQSTLT